MQGTMSLKSEEKFASGCVVLPMNTTRNYLTRRMYYTLPASQKFQTQRSFDVMSDKFYCANSVLK